MSSAGETSTRALTGAPLRSRSGACGRRAHHGLAGAGDDLAHAEAEGQLALEDVEALLLLGVHVRAGHVAVGRQRELELEQLAAGVGGGPEELDRLAGDGVLDDLSGVGHGERPCGSGCGEERLPLPASRVVGATDDLGAPEDESASSRRRARVIPEEDDVRSGPGRRCGRARPDAGS